jgi:hypothetical protein
MKKSILLVIFILTFSSVSSAVSISMNSQTVFFNNIKMFVDYDPLIDINITVKINSIRALKQIDDDSNANFFVNIFINNLEFISPIFNENKYLYNLNFSVTTNIPDDVENVIIKIQLWDWSPSGNKLCDISGDKNKSDIELAYSIKTGHWTGDDYLGDPSGYGRLNGCDDGSIYTPEKDCELWFNIYQNDFDSDGIPYWTEVNIYGTDPTVDNRGEDLNNDGILIEWDWKWGYDPFTNDNHSKQDPDNDSISNFEEYLTKDFNSDPFRKDVFLEIDYMQEANGEVPRINKSAFEILKQPFHKRNIVFHIDSGEINGGEVIPYDEKSDFKEVLDIWRNYFLNNDTHNWRRGVFHYAVFVHDQFPKGFAFSGDVAPYWGYIPGTDSFVVANTLVEKKTRTLFKSNDTIYASLLMHEIGHNFGIRSGNPGGCDNQFTKNPLGLGWYIWRNYKSIMNYRYTYSILDYSDGSHGKRDYDDWAAINLSYFEIPENPNFLTNNN